MSRDAARRCLHHALVELDRQDSASVPQAIRWVGKAMGELIDMDRPSAPPTTLPPATAGLHADGRSVVSPVAAPPSDTASEGCPSPHESAGNPGRGGGSLA